MSVYRPYAGIGSRDTPRALWPLLEKSAAGLARNGFTLRSGGARGADSVFAWGHNRAEPRPGCKIAAPEIFRPDPPPPAWTYELVKQYVDPGRNFDTFSPGTKGLLARNMQQILGVNGDAHSLFVLYWTLPDTFETDAAGGTRYALRCAEAHGIPMLNLGRPGSTTVSEVLDWCRTRLQLQP